MNEISFTSIIRFAVKNLKCLIIVALIFAIGTFCYCNFIATPRYTATGSVLVTNGAITNGAITNGATADSKKVNSTDIAASLGLADTIADVLKTNEIYKDLSNTINHKFSYSQLKSHTSVSRRNESSLFIDVTFTASSSSDAVRILNEFLDLSPSYISELIPNSKVTVTTTADAAVKTYPRTMLYTIVAAVISSMLTLCILLFFKQLNNVISCEEDFKSSFKTPVLGTVPDFSCGQKGNSYRNYYKGDYSHEK